MREWKRCTTSEFGLWSAAAAVSEAAGLDGLARILQAAGRGEASNHPLTGCWPFLAALRA